MSAPRTPRTPRACAVKLATQNAGVITRNQALQAGLSRRQIDGLLAAGEWRTVHRGVYVLGDALPSWETRAMAAVRAAERCPITGVTRVVAVSHMAAAVLHGIRDERAALPELTVLGTNRPVLQGVRIHRTSALDNSHIQLVRGIPATTGARMVCDLSQPLPDNLFIPILDDTICARAASRRRVHECAMGLRPGRPFIARVIALTEPGAEGTFRSFLERASSQAIAAAGLPQPRWNVPVHDQHGQIGVVDALWDWIPLIMEVEGLRFHTQPAERQRDAERFNRLTDVARVRRFTYRDVMQRSDYVIASLREALAAGARGSAPSAGAL